MVGLERDRNRNNNNNSNHPQGQGLIVPRVFSTNMSNNHPEHRPSRDQREFRPGGVPGIQPWVMQVRLVSCALAVLIFLAFRMVSFSFV